jgi:hypothetical protein
VHNFCLIEKYLRLQKSIASTRLLFLTGFRCLGFVIICFFSCCCGFFCSQLRWGLVFGLCFLFGLWFGVCLVVVVEAFFHIACGWLWIGCGRQKASFRTDISLLAGLLLEMVQAPSNGCINSKGNTPKNIIMVQAQPTSLKY